MPGEVQCTLSLTHTSPGTSLLCRLLFIMSTFSVPLLWLWSVTEVGYLGWVRKGVCCNCVLQGCYSLCMNPSDGQPVVRGKAGLQSGFWPEIQWTQILADVNTLHLALDIAQ